MVNKCRQSIVPEMGRCGGEPRLDLAQPPANLFGPMAPAPARWLPPHPDTGGAQPEPAGPVWVHGRMRDRRRGVSSSRISSARWRRRRVSVGPAVASEASIFSSIRGSATVRGKSGRSRYGEFFNFGSSVRLSRPCQ
jgi:hypothetical protein